MEKKVIENFEDLPKNSKCCLYGSGQSGKVILNGLNYHRPDITVPFLVDTYKTGTCFGLEIIKPQALCNEKRNSYDYILITSSYREEIIQTLDSLCISNFIIASDNLWGKSYVSCFYETNKADSTLFNNIVIEFCSTKCNMSCKFCEREHEPHMNFDFFKMIIDEIAENKLTKIVNIVGIGEPLIDPLLENAISYCKHNNLMPITFTNGLNLTTKKYVNLVELGLSRLYISLHNLSQETFNYRGAKIPFSRYFNNIMSCIDYNAAHSLSSEITIRLLYDVSENFTASKLWDMPAMKGNTENALSLFNIFLDPVLEISKRNNLLCHLNKDVFKIAFDKMKKTQSGQFLQIMKNIKLNLAFLIPPPIKDDDKHFKVIPKTEGTCHAFNTPSISSDGKFKVACCGKYPLSIGRVTKNNSIMSIVNSNKYKSIIRGFKDNRLIRKECQLCHGETIVI